MSARLLFVYNRDSSFIELDRQILAQRFDVQVCGRRSTLLNPLAMAAKVLRSDVVFGWFAHWHTFWAVTLARLFRRPCVLVVGGFDTASMPEIGYGLQRGGWRRPISRWTMRRATQLIVNSAYIRDEVQRNVGIAADQIDVVHHGIPDPFGELPDPQRERIALTVGAIDHPNLRRKGLHAFVETAALLPDARFIVVGDAHGNAIDELRAIAADNIEFAGRVSDDALNNLYRRSAVYVQASAHEGFGMAVAEAMLAGCIPIVTRAGALPEVAGESGEIVERADARELAPAIERGFGASAEQRAAARARVLEVFPLDKRRERILGVVDAVLGAGKQGAA
jgi:glycosyltransferase involved in cell wall biosynthesis